MAVFPNTKNHTASQEAPEQSPDPDEGHHHQEHPARRQKAGFPGAGNES